MKQVGFSCIDIFEAPNIEGQNPFAGKTALEGEQWCGEHGKRLCTLQEWSDACEGTYETFPKIIPKAGVVEAPGQCNNDKWWILPDEKKMQMDGPESTTRELARLWQGEPSGLRPGCVSKIGVHDLIGNVEEWVVSPDDKYGYALMGHYWSTAAKSCTDRVSVHSPNWFYFATGFRCCADLRPDFGWTDGTGIETVDSAIAKKSVL